MKEAIIKNFTILISSPSDMSNYATLVRSEIEKYNTERGISSGVVFVPKDWKHNTMPNYGKSGQKIINEQIVDDSDAVIALFGAKFGSPTEDFDSGTLEEIERAYQNGAEVLTYFGSGKLVDISSIDTNQLEKVRSFKASYNGLYYDFTSKQSLKNKIRNDLILLSQKLVKKNEKDLKIYSYKNGELQENLVYESYDFLKNEEIEKLKQSIERNIKLINETHIEKQNEVPVNSNVSDNLLKLTSFTNALYEKEDIILPSDLEYLLVKYCKEYGLSISEDFFDYGQACYRGMPLRGYDVCGSSSEIKKAKALLNLGRQIKKYYSYVTFFNQFNNLYYLPLIIKNESNIFADDITIKIFIPRKCFYDYHKLKLDAECICEEVKDFPEVFDVEETVDVSGMNYGTKQYPIKMPKVSGLGLSYDGPDLEYCRDYFKTIIENQYPYIKNTQGDYEVLKFEIPQGIKQFTSQFLCAKLMFISKADEIKYTITSKSFGHEIKGNIKIA